MSADEIVRTRTGGQFKTLAEYGEWARANNGSFAPLWKVPIPGTSHSDYDNLELSDLPEFHYHPAGIAADLKNSLDKTGLMVGLGILLFFLSFVSFIRYDVR